ncbi:MAG: hypothetical protein IPL39_04965 [Opitutaceae bacterium]|nr:hypothetical protein [Opitutaceae bacterium]
MFTSRLFPLCLLVTALNAAPATTPAPELTPPPPASPASARPPPAIEPAKVGPELNLRTLGAIGDGQPHPVSEWIAAKKYKNLRDLQRDYPFVTSLEWSTDETAFQRALLDLPADGGTIRIPPGRYVATAYGWRIDRDHVRLLGAGARDTMLSTGPKLEEGLVLAPYRHGGWRQGIDQEYPFAPDSGAASSPRLRLREPARVADFHAGELIFIRNGACRFDQDYGEFNEVAGTTPEGDLLLEHPLARDYTLASLNWANETAEPLTLPKPGKSVTIRVRTGEGFFELPKSGAITVGEALLEIVRRDGDKVTLRNPLLRPANGAAGATPAISPPSEPPQPTPATALGFNPPARTILPASTKIGKSRSVIKLTRTTRDFRAQGLRVFGRRKALNLSNSYQSSFADCDFVRRPDAAVQGGLTLDGDGGRFAEFRNCSLRGTLPCGMQFARSFGDISFTDCMFIATNVVFSEFCFSATLQDSRLQVPSALGSAIIVGRSCGDLRITDNQIVVTGGTLTIFDAPTDIRSQKLDAPGRLVIHDNRIVAPGKPRVFFLHADRPADISGNTLNHKPVDPPGANATTP